MSRGSVRCLSLLVCVCFTLSMLFSDILKVDAAVNRGSASSSTSISGSITADGVCNWSNIIGSISNGSGSIQGPDYTNSSGFNHYEIPINFSVSRGDLGLNPSSPNNIILVWFSTGDVTISGDATIQNVYIRDSGGDLIRPLYSSGLYGSKGYYMTAANIFDAEWHYTHFTAYVCFDAYFTNKEQLPVREGMNDYTELIKSFSMTIPFTVHYRDASLQEMGETNQQLYELNESTEAIEESVTSDTGGGILATIKNFFGSFFQNVFDTLVSVFVPEDGFFSDWFNRLNTLLSEKLGMLYAPFDLLITTLTAIMNADTTDSGIPFPGIQWEDTYLVEPFTFYFSSLGDTFTDLQGYVYFATDTVLLFAFLYLLQNKIRLILEGHESG